ncbi:hypothetical protein tinsulaeT_37780 [Thalassotalea insulae]|uniref:Cardiolipin synthase N-terminal domain-containing protein n=1 Tax=Thalassotalea insulae TaxID=2056778 RepID=A0ABQ6GWX4_9GAMM|nr:hypothetical protein [Thalassotalea insulae]GLX80438.1 hypothetical protein tinsulaeT_37780 [Thalassotalea insulae]
MYVIFMPIVAILYLITVTVLSYRLGKTKTENPKMAAIIGFVLAFLPPLALIYLAVLLFKEEVSIV